MELFDSNATLLTPNRRLSAVLLKQYNEQQIQNGKTAWHSMDILPFTSWLQRLWHDICAKEIVPQPLLLTPAQEAILWENILRKSPANELLLQLSTTAELAKSAWGLLKQWQVNLDDPTLKQTEDSLAFQQWAEQFQILCQQNNWIDTQSLAEIIIEKINLNAVSIPKKIILVGFTEISPQHQNLLNTCKKLGTDIIFWQSNKIASHIHQTSLNDEEAEICAMAQWAKKIFDSTNEKKSYLIGCVIPKLDILRETALTIFSDIFSENNTITHDQRSLPFNISAGKSLTSYPLIHAAFQALKSPTEHISIDLISTLLRSPFLGESEQEYLKRASYDSHLRNANFTKLSLKQMIDPTFAYYLGSGCPALAKRITDYVNSFSQHNNKLLISQWCHVIMELLSTLGWPGERSLNSVEYQVMQRWLEMLSEVKTFDLIMGPQRFFDAVRYLMQMSTNITFQPQTPEAPIQVLGVLEAAGLPFEHVWIMGMDDTNWPSPPKPNPFIPQRLQKKLQMPHASAERELSYCESLIKQFQQSTNNIIYSYALQNDVAELRPSVFLNSVPKILTTSDFTPLAQTVFFSKKIESFTDAMGPAIHEEEKIRGGMSIFKQQAACPFKAFSELRLSAKKIETPRLGIKPPDRGNLVHKALELIWQEIGDSNALHQYSPYELQALIERNAKLALEYVLDTTPTAARYLSLELKRLTNLLHKWMDLELARPSFTVLSREQEYQVTVNRLSITLRIDRIDQLSDGQQIIIDYKTGKNNNIKDWFGERPSEPQLPLYSVTEPDKTVSIAFAEIHPESMGLNGISKTDIGIKSIIPISQLTYSNNPIWNNQLDEWKHVLNTLSDHFHQGIATVDPKEGETTCRLCNLHSFCRIYETQAATS